MVDVPRALFTVSFERLVFCATHGHHRRERSCEMAAERGARRTLSQVPWTSFLVQALSSFSASVAVASNSSSSCCLACDASASSSSCLALAAAAFSAAASCAALAAAAASSAALAASSASAAALAVAAASCQPRHMVSVLSQERLARWQGRSGAPGSRAPEALSGC